MDWKRKKKNAIIICYMLMSLVSLYQRNLKKSEKLMKIVNIDEENLHVFWMIWENSKKFSGKMWLMLILKVTKKQRFTSSLEISLYKPHWGHIFPAEFLGLMLIIIFSAIIYFARKNYSFVSCQKTFTKWHRNYSQKTQQNANKKCMLGLCT